MKDIDKLEELTNRIERNRWHVLIGSCVLCFMLGTAFGVWLVYQRGTVVRIEAVETVEEEPGITL